MCNVLRAARYNGASPWRVPCSANVSTLTETRVSKMLTFLITTQGQCYKPPL